MRFEAKIEVPPNTGKIVSTAWDFEGKATFPIEGTIVYGDEEGSQAVVRATYSFSHPGTYFPVLRAGSSRNGDNEDLFTQVLNLCRVRVVVK